MGTLNKKLSKIAKIYTAQTPISNLLFIFALL